MLLRTLQFALLTGELGDLRPFPFLVGPLLLPDRLPVLVVCELNFESRCFFGLVLWIVLVFSIWSAADR